jgi:hypothetical protein
MDNWFSTYFQRLIGRCSLVYGASIMQDRDLNEYNPSRSSTSKHLSCSHRLCELGSNCKSPKQPCPYTVEYYTENTSSSGMLVEDTLHLASGGGNTSNPFVQAPVVIGCALLIMPATSIFGNSMCSISKNF